METIVFILSVTLSILIVNKINCYHELFKGIKSKIIDLDEKKKKTFKIISFLLICIVLQIMDWIKFNMIMKGLVFGVLYSIREIALGRTLVEEVK